jgi:hypothetical protein
MLMTVVRLVVHLLAAGVALGMVAVLVVQVAVFKLQVAVVAKV